ncbi:mercury(II) reductase [Haloechinothrix sp. LS1_15]|uniref:mercury(II) reductase n=1 Tax=Haloechinothrix sp. LS1_15 TaxID=2652248 RepID=UPI0029468608|nr:mercury(II) reductase [Haloechinothrix sp. LS1_15]MDV6013604.1 mercury(II) reductase [Haloechinothrix sp. LS1_15]
MHYDLAIIGSGSAAFAAAITARGHGRSVVMIERGTLGGTCVNTGCVPSKALLAAAEERQVALADHVPGIHTDAGATDLAALSADTGALVARLRNEKYRDLAAEYGWQVLSGTARFLPDPAIEVTRPDGETTTLDAEHYLIATGSAPALPPVPGLAEAGYLTSAGALALDTVPESLIVLGGSAVGLEHAQLWSRLGARVTVVELASRLAPSAEPELGRTLEAAFRDEGIAVVTGARTHRVDRAHHDGDGYRDGYRVALDAPDTGTTELRAEQLLVATGRAPVTDALDLDAVGVTRGERGEVVADPSLRTANPRVWATGDVTGGPQFVYVAAAHGTVAADNALTGAGRTLDYRHLPAVIFTSPTLASAGMTEAEALDAGFDCECRILDLEYVPRALVNRDTRGVIKLVAERDTGRLLGAHMLAHGAGDAIAAAVYAVATGMTVHRMAELWLPYLTMAEGLKLTAQTFTRDVSKLSCCAA